MQNNSNLKPYKLLALCGILVMGIGSFLSCLATTQLWSLTGTGLLILSLVMTIVAFSKWQP